jgi:hypothetical protein
MPLGFWTIILTGMAGLANHCRRSRIPLDKRSSADEMRIGSELESQDEMASGPYCEFTPICIAMHVGPDSGALDRWNGYPWSLIFPAYLRILFVVCGCLENLITNAIKYSSFGHRFACPPIRREWKKKGRKPRSELRITASVSKVRN